MLEGFGLQSGGGPLVGKAGEFALREGVEGFPAAQSDHRRVGVEDAVHGGGGDE